MRPEWRVGIAAVLALAGGATLAVPYAHLAAPYYAAIDRLIARSHCWTVEGVTVTVDPSGRGSVLRLIGEVRRQRADVSPAAIVVSRVQVGGAIEAPVVFWALLLVWPAACGRQLWMRVAVGAALFLLLEAITTGAELVHPMGETSAMLADPSLASHEGPLSPWERWSRFLEAGGNFALAVAGALATVAVSKAGAAGRAAD